MNFDAWALFDDDSCVAGTQVQIEIKSVAGLGRYQVEGPGMFYSDELAFNLVRGGFDDDDVHILNFVTWPQAVYSSRKYPKRSVSFIFCWCNYLFCFS